MLNIFLKVKNNHVMIMIELIDKHRKEVFKENYFIKDWRKDKVRYLNDIKNKIREMFKIKTFNNVKVVLSSEKIFYDVYRLQNLEYKNKDQILEQISEMYQMIEDSYHLVEVDNGKKKEYIKYYVIPTFEYELLNDFKESFNCKKYKSYFEIEMINNKIKKDYRSNGINIIINNDNIHFCGFRDSEMIEYMILKNGKNLNLKDVTDFLFEVSDYILVKYIKIFILNEIDMKTATLINDNLRVWMGINETYEIIKL